jgi:hypothetical protein
MTSDLLLALLAMDAYNQGFGAGIAGKGVVRYTR